MTFISRQILGALVAAALVTAAVAGCGSATPPTASTQAAATSASGSAAPGAGKPPVTIGTKNFAEEFILGQLYAQALRAKGFTVNLKNDIGSSEVVDRALVSGQVDAYPEYTGTILSVLAHRDVRPASPAEAYALARAFERGRGLDLLNMAPASDTNVLVTKPAYATAHHLSSSADLARLGSSATLGAPPEFRTRFSGLLGLEQVYGVRGLRFKALPIGTQYAALDSGEVQIANAFTTDGQLSQGGYTLLSDPRNVFSFQNVTFVIGGGALKREGPEFARIVDAVSAKLSTQALQVMNAAVVLDQQSPAAVARQFLGANGLT